MASFAHLEQDLLCPHCGNAVSSLTYFQWGYCRSYLPHKDYDYHPGDQVRWKTCRDESIPTWIHFVDGERSYGANIGDPSFRNIIVREGHDFYWDKPEDRRRCPACDMPIDGVVVEIRDATVRGARIYQPGEFDDYDISYWIIEANDRLTPMPEWTQHSMGHLHPDC